MRIAPDVGIDAPVRSAGDGHDDAPAESAVGLYKTELIRRNGPCEAMAEVELATLHYIDLYNNVRRPSACGWMDGNPPSSKKHANKQHGDSMATASRNARAIPSSQTPPPRPSAPRGRVADSSPLLRAWAMDTERLAVVGPTQEARQAAGSDRWGAWWVRRHYARDGFNDAGEQAALKWLAATVDQADVLDLGVGGGRTASLLAPMARRYVAVDVSPGMVRLARRRHPGLDVRHGDARRLPGFEDGAFDLVVFSNNGIDAVSHDERELVLGEIARLSRPGGLVLLSTFSVDGGTRRQRPDFSELWRPTDRPAIAAVAVRAKRLIDALMAHHYERQTRTLTQVGQDWAIAPLRAHEYRFAVHFIRLGAAVSELSDHGLDVVAAFAPDGAVLDITADRTSADYMHLIARRRAT